MRLSEEVQRQIARLISLGFPELLGVTPAAYASRFAGIDMTRMSDRKEFSLFLIVEGAPSISLKEHHKSAGVIEYVDSDGLTTTGFQPNGPYGIWTHDGLRHSGMSASKARSGFSPEEVPCSQLEVVSFLIQYPELVRGRAIDSGRTFSRDDYFSTILWVSERPELALHHPEDLTNGMSLLSRLKVPGDHV